MGLTEFKVVAKEAAEYFPSEEMITGFWSKLQGLDLDGSVSAIKRRTGFNKKFPTIKPVVVSAFDGMSDQQICESILSILEIYYPNLIAEVIESRENGDTKPGDRMVDIVLKFVEEVRNG